MQTSDILNCLRKCKLRPNSFGICEPTPFTQPSLIGTQFFSIDFYWDEYYFDSLQFSTKIENLKTEINQLIASNPKYTNPQWGASDGHLFVYITIKS